jgi:fused signal recognition particle receptor
MSRTDPKAGAGRLDRLRESLRRTREGMVNRIGSLFGGGKPLDDWSGRLEEALIQADLGPRAAAQIVAAVKSAPEGKPPSWDGVRETARRVLREILTAQMAPRAGGPHRPEVVLVVGVNGGGKTTTAGKLASRWRGEGKKVVLCAADTFRAGAGEQLRLWAERVGADFVGSRPGSDPSAVVFDALGAALSRGADVLIVDTAGRLHTQDPLMRELEKIVRVVSRRIGGAPHDVLLVLDSTTGQNGVNQARQFLSAARVSGLIVTKLDGTAKGGVAVRIVQELGIPLRYIGTGEGPDDLVDFDPDEFLEGLLPTAA